MARSISKCPDCGEPVSQFAAGCAICGADLENARREKAKRAESRRLPRPEVPRAISFGDSGDVLFGIVMALMALATPPVALIFDGLMAYRFHEDGREGMRNVALLCVAAALIFLIFPFGVWYRIRSGL